MNKNNLCYCIHTLQYVKHHCVAGYLLVLIIIYYYYYYCYYYYLRGENNSQPPCMSIVDIQKWITKRVTFRQVIKFKHKKRLVVGNTSN